jgi:hypothetical protein
MSCLLLSATLLAVDHILKRLQVIQLNKAFAHL